MMIYRDIRKKGIDGNTLKIIAMIIMLLDHIGAAVIKRLDVMQIIDLYDNRNLMLVHTCLRLIGRTAFPIFCFLLIEGFLHTRNVKKYVLRLLLFAVISEIPFDLALFGRMNWGYQNVYFTLFLGLITIWGIREITTYVTSKMEHHSNSRYSLFWKKLTIYFASGILIGITCKIANLLKTDYNWIGVLFIATLYLFQHYQKIGNLIGYLELYVISSMEIYSFPAWILKFFYNGKRGSNFKYLFYLFYPVHLLVLYGICQLCVHFI